MVFLYNDISRSWSKPASTLESSRATFASSVKPSGSGSRIEQPAKGSSQLPTVYDRTRNSSRSALSGPTRDSKIPAAQSSSRLASSADAQPARRDSSLASAQNTVSGAYTSAAKTTTDGSTKQPELWSKYLSPAKPSMSVSGTKSSAGSSVTQFGSVTASDDLYRKSKRLTSSNYTSRLSSDFHQRNSGSHDAPSSRMSASMSAREPPLTFSTTYESRPISRNSWNPTSASHSTALSDKAANNSSIGSTYQASRRPLSFGSTSTYSATNVTKQQPDESGSRRFLSQASNLPQRATERQSVTSGASRIQKSDTASSGIPGASSIRSCNKPTTYSSSRIPRLVSYYDSAAKSTIPRAMPVSESIPDSSKAAKPSQVVEEGRMTASEATFKPKQSHASSFVESLRNSGNKGYSSGFLSNFPKPYSVNATAATKDSRAPSKLPMPTSASSSKIAKESSTKYNTSANLTTSKESAAPSSIRSSLIPAKSLGSIKPRITTTKPSKASTRTDDYDDSSSNDDENQTKVPASPRSKKFRRRSKTRSKEEPTSASKTFDRHHSSDGLLSPAAASSSSFHRASRLRPSKSSSEDEASPNSAIKARRRRLQKSKAVLEENRHPRINAVSGQPEYKQYAPEYANPSVPKTSHAFDSSFRAAESTNKSAFNNKGSFNEYQTTHPASRPAGPRSESQIQKPGRPTVRESLELKTLPEYIYSSANRYPGNQRQADVAVRRTTDVRSTASQLLNNLRNKRDDSYRVYGSNISAAAPKSIPANSAEQSSCQNKNYLGVCHSESQPGSTAATSSSLQPLVIKNTVNSATNSPYLSILTQHSSPQRQQAAKASPSGASSKDDYLNEESSDEYQQRSTRELIETFENKSVDEPKQRNKSGSLLHRITPEREKTPPLCPLVQPIIIAPTILASTTVSSVPIGGNVYPALAHNKRTIAKSKPLQTEVSKQYSYEPKLRQPRVRIRRGSKSNVIESAPLQTAVPNVASKIFESVPKPVKKPRKDVPKAKSCEEPLVVLTEVKERATEKASQEQPLNSPLQQLSPRLSSSARLSVRSNSDAVTIPVLLITPTISAAKQSNSSGHSHTNSSASEANSHSPKLVSHIIEESSPSGYSSVEIDKISGPPESRVPDEMVKAQNNGLATAFPVHSDSEVLSNNSIPKPKSIARTHYDDRLLCKPVKERTMKPRTSSRIVAVVTPCPVIRSQLQEQIQVLSPPSGSRDLAESFDRELSVLMSLGEQMQAEQRAAAAQRALSNAAAKPWHGSQPLSSLAPPEKNNPAIPANDYLNAGPYPINAFDQTLFSSVNSIPKPWKSSSSTRESAKNQHKKSNLEIAGEKTEELLRNAKETAWQRQTEPSGSSATNSRFEEALRELDNLCTDSLQKRPYQSKGNKSSSKDNGETRQFYGPPMNEDKMSFTKKWLENDLHSFAQEDAKVPDLLDFGGSPNQFDWDQRSLGSASAEVAAITNKDKYLNKQLPDLLPRKNPEIVVASAWNQNVRQTAIQHPHQLAYTQGSSKGKQQAQPSQTTANTAQSSAAPVIQLWLKPQTSNFKHQSAESLNRTPWSSKGAAPLSPTNLSGGSKTKELTLVTKRIEAFERKSGDECSDKMSASGGSIRSSPYRTEYGAERVPQRIELPPKIAEHQQKNAASSQGFGAQLQNRGSITSLPLAFSSNYYFQKPTLGPPRVAVRSMKSLSMEPICQPDSNQVKPASAFSPCRDAASNSSHSPFAAAMVASTKSSDWSTGSRELTPSLNLSSWTLVDFENDDSKSASRSSRLNDPTTEMMDIVAELELNTSSEDTGSQRNMFPIDTDRSSESSTPQPGQPQSIQKLRFSGNSKLPLHVIPEQSESNHTAAPEKVDYFSSKSSAPASKAKTILDSMRNDDNVVRLKMHSRKSSLNSSNSDATREDLGHTSCSVVVKRSPFTAGPFVSAVVPQLTVTSLSQSPPLHRTSASATVLPASVGALSPNSSMAFDLSSVCSATSDDVSSNPGETTPTAALFQKPQQSKATREYRAFTPEEAVISCSGRSSAGATSPLSSTNERSSNSRPVAPARTSKLQNTSTFSKPANASKANERPLLSPLSPTKFHSGLSDDRPEPPKSEIPLPPARHRTSHKSPPEREVPAVQQIVAAEADDPTYDTPESGNNQSDDSGTPTAVTSPIFGSVKSRVSKRGSSAGIRDTSQQNEVDKGNTNSSSITTSPTSTSDTEYGSAEANSPDIWTAKNKTTAVKESEYDNVNSVQARRRPSQNLPQFDHKPDPMYQLPVLTPTAIKISNTVIGKIEDVVPSSKNPFKSLFKKFKGSSGSDSKQTEDESGIEDNSAKLRAASTTSLDRSLIQRTKSAKEEVKIRGNKPVHKSKSSHDTEQFVLYDNGPRRSLAENRSDAIIMLDSEPPCLAVVTVSKTTSEAKKSSVPANTNTKQTASAKKFKLPWMPWRRD